MFCTCSLEPEEGEDIIRAALAEDPRIARKPLAVGEFAGLDGFVTPQTATCGRCPASGRIPIRGSPGSTASTPRACNACEPVFSSGCPPQTLRYVVE